MHHIHCNESDDGSTRKQKFYDYGGSNNGTSGKALRVLCPHGHSHRRIFVLYNKLCWLAAATNDWYSPKKDLISIPVTLLISKIASYTVALQEEKLYLSPGIGYCALTTWFAEYNRTSTENLNDSSQIVSLTVKTTEKISLRLKCPFLEKIHLTGMNTSGWLKWPSGQTRCCICWKIQTTATIHYTGQGHLRHKCVSRLRKAISYRF